MNRFNSVFFTTGMVLVCAVSVLFPELASAATDIFAKPTSKFDAFMEWVNAFVPHLVVLSIIVGGLGLMFPKAMRLDASVWKGIIIGAIIIGSADAIATFLTD